MSYLQPTDYATYGLAADTTDDWAVMASAVMDAYCRRTSLNPTQYTERLRVVAGSQTVRLSYLPLVTVAPATLPFVSIQGRLTRPRRGEIPYPELGEVAYAFSLPGMWTAIDPTTVDWVPDTGEIILPYNLLGLAYGEVEVVYTAGLAVIPPAVQVACAQIIKNAQATPGFNVQRSKIDTMQMQYFSGSIVDPQVQLLLAPYVADEAGLTMSDLSVRPYNEGQVRAADSLLRSMGGFAVGLRFPAPAAAGVDAEQLGLSVPVFQDLPLSPAVFRKVRSVMSEGNTGKYELLVSASAVAAAVAAQQVASSDVLFAQATGVIVNGVLLLIEANSFTEWQGNACMYRVLLRESVPDAFEESVG